MSLDEAARYLGMRWRTLKGWMLDMGWIIEMGGSQPYCTYEGRAQGYVSPLHEVRHAFGQSIQVETGYRIMPAGLAILKLVRDRQ